jgi:hypothetical protein
VRQLLPCFELIFARPIVALEEAQFPKPGGNSTVLSTIADFASLALQ